MDNLNVNGGGNVIIPADPEVIFKDAIIFEKEGCGIIGRLDIKCDFTDLDPSLHHLALSILMSKRMRLMVPSDAWIEKTDRWEKTYKKKKAEYETLPWYRKLFKVKPYYGMSE